MTRAGALPGESGVPLGRGGSPPVPAERHRDRWLWRLAALASGALTVPAFPAPSLWWWAFVALVPATLVVAAAPTRRSGTVRGWFAGAGYTFGAVYWLAPNIGPGLFLVAFGLGALLVPWGWLTWELFHGSPGPGRAAAAMVLLPSTWVLSEYARSWSSLGGPWAVLGTSQWNDRDFLALASAGGVWLVSLVLVLVNTAVAVVLRAPAWRLRAVASGTAAATFATAFAFGALRGDPHPVESWRIALVQPGPGLGPAARFTHELAETASVAAAHPRLVVWGESSVSYDLSHDFPRLTRLETLSRSVGADILVNEDARRSGHGIYKSATLVGPRGILSEYDKMRLVPFGEYIPFRSALGWLTDVSRAAAEDRRRGSSLVRMDIAPGQPAVGPLISFEETFPDMARKLVAGLGASVLVYQSSDLTFQGSWEPRQHAALAAVRAVETGAVAVQVALTGDSSAFDAGGKQLLWLAPVYRGAKIVDLPLAPEITFYDTWGDWVPLGAFLALAGSGIVTGGLRYRRLRHRQSGVPIEVP